MHAFARTNRRAIAMMFVRPSVCLVRACIVIIRCTLVRICVYGCMALILFCNCVMFWALCISAIKYCLPRDITGAVTECQSKYSCIFHEWPLFLRLSLSLPISPHLPSSPVCPSTCVGYGGLSLTGVVTYDATATVC